jgi:hypothetical protein
MRQRVGVISVGVQHFRYAFGHAGALPLGPQPISQKRQRTTDNGINAAGPNYVFRWYASDGQQEHN